jgi:tyrosine phenol-lyase
VDVVIDAAHDPTDPHPFKGNVDVDKFEALVREVGRERIPYFSLAATVNMAGGQPISLGNVRELRAACQRHGIPIYLDATRLMENAFFIQEREPGYAEQSLAAIVKEFCGYTDGAWMSAKKDGLVNIGGWLAVNGAELYETLRNLVVVYEGLYTYGGMAGRDMEAMAIGLVESLQQEYMRARIGQVRYLGELMAGWGLPIVQPIGGHAVYLEAGIRAAERGALSAGRDPKTGQNLHPRLELVRLTIPRRVSTQSHMDLVAEAVQAVYARRERVRGLKLVYEPKLLRFFEARMERL